MPFWDHAFFRIAPQIYRRAKKVENTTSYVLRGNFNLPIPHSSAVTTTLSITIDWDCKGKLLFENYPTHLSWSKNPTFWIDHGHYQWIPSALEPYKKILIKPEILNKRKNIISFLVKLGKWKNGVLTSALVWFGLELVE